MIQTRLFHLLILEIHEQYIFELVQAWSSAAFPPRRPRPAKNNQPMFNLALWSRIRW